MDVTTVILGSYILIVGTLLGFIALIVSILLSLSRKRFNISLALLNLILKKTMTITLSVAIIGFMIMLVGTFL